MIELLEPSYLKRLVESMEGATSALSHLITTFQNVGRAGFDDAGRLRVRTEYLDDGYVRVRDSSGTVDLLEVLRELSWSFYGLAEARSLLDKAVGEADKPPPDGGVTLLGFDGSALRRVKVTSDGKLLAVLG